MSNPVRVLKILTGFFHKLFIYPSANFAIVDGGKSSAGFAQRPGCPGCGTEKIKYELALRRLVYCWYFYRSDKVRYEKKKRSTANGD
jgi:hypothetical protein